jgi:hypothetical protein
VRIETRAHQNNDCDTCFIKYSHSPKLRQNFCAVFNLVPWAWKLGIEVMDLCRVKLFTPSLSPVMPYLGPETFLLEDTLVLPSEQLNLLHFVQASFQNLVSAYSQTCHRVPCWLRGSQVMLLAVLHGSQVMLLAVLHLSFKDVYIFILQHEASLKYWELFCKQEIS